MADYPSSIKIFPTLVDGADSVLALHQNERGGEITAIETELGVTPKGSDASVAARLARIDTSLLDLVGSSGWVAVSETWTRTADHAFTVAGDLTAKYRKGAKVRYKQGGGYEYGIVKSSSYSAPNTTVTLIENTDYAMAAGTVTDTYLSYIENPEGFPSEFNFSAAITGVTVGNGTVVQKFSVAGNIFLYHVEFNFGSTSAISSIAFTSPVTPLNYDVNARNALGIAILFDASSETGYQCIVVLDPVGKLAIRYSRVSGSFVVNGATTTTIPFTWADGDKFTMNGSFKW